jgi:hypothetical protein
LAAYFDEVFDPFYAGVPNSKECYTFGHIFYATAYYPHQQLEVWRPDELDTRLGIAKNFNIKASGADFFHRSLPYTSPTLATNEEFIAIKAKQRPVILLQPPDRSLLDIKKGQYSGKIVRHLCPVALVFSAENEAGDAKFPREFIERIRRLGYRQFMFMPKGGPLKVDSIARFDEVQSVAEHQLKPTGYALAPEVCDIAKSQASYFLTDLSGKDFGEWAALFK